MQITGQYLIQSESGRPAGHVLGILVRILIHCRVSFEFLLAVSGMPKWKHGVNF